MMMMMIVRRLRLRPIYRREHLLSLEGVTIALVSHDYAFINEVCTDTVAPQQQQDNHGTRATTTATAMAIPRNTTRCTTTTTGARVSRASLCTTTWRSRSSKSSSRRSDPIPTCLIWQVDHPNLPNMARSSSRWPEPPGFPSGPSI